MLSPVLNTRACVSNAKTASSLTCAARGKFRSWQYIPATSLATRLSATRRARITAQRIAVARVGRAARGEKAVLSLELLQGHCSRQRGQTETKHFMLTTSFWLLSPKPNSVPLTYASCLTSCAVMEGLGLGLGLRLGLGLHHRNAQQRAAMVRHLHQVVHLTLHSPWIFKEGAGYVADVRLVHLLC